MQFVALKSWHRKLCPPLPRLQYGTRLYVDAKATGKAAWTWPPDVFMKRSETSAPVEDVWRWEILRGETLMCNIYDDLFGGMFDLNGDGKTTMDEAFLVMQLLEKAEQAQGNEQTRIAYQHCQASLRKRTT